MIDELFMTILDMTKTGSIAILAVIALRFLLRKAPKVISYALWGVVLFRLLCPVSLELPVSVMPDIAPVKDSYSLADKQISFVEAGTAAYNAIDSALAGTGGLSHQMIPVTESSTAGNTTYVSVKWTELVVILGQYVWLLGVVAMAVYSTVSYGRLRKRMAVRISLGDGIYLADDIRFPFVTGVFRPKIYLPSTMEAQEYKYVLAHERHHIRRMDPMWKGLGFLALSLHWFNPLVWAAFILAGKDMEMSCDEAVIRQMGSQACADYAQSLATLATGRRAFTGTPLAFVEGDPKSRIRNLVNWKKPVVWVVVTAAVISTILAVCLLVNPMRTALSGKQSTLPDDIRPLPPENPGSSLIAYDPDRQIYIASENVYVDYYIGITNLPNISVEIISREYIDPADISVDLPEDIPFVVNFGQYDNVKRKTELMLKKNEPSIALPYYVYYMYQGGDPKKIDENTAIEERFRELAPEDLPEFYVYSISVAFVNIKTLEEPVILETLDITIGDKTYNAKLGRVRIFPKEDFPAETSDVRRRGGYLGHFFDLYNDGIVKLSSAYEQMNVPEDMTLTGIRMLEEESEILDITLVVTSGKNTVTTKWDGKTPFYLYKGDRVYIEVVLKNELTQKLLNRVHLQVIVEYTLDSTGERVSEVTTHLNGSMDVNYHEYYAIIFDGVDMEPYYREYFYQHYKLWMDDYRDK